MNTVNVRSVRIGNTEIFPGDTLTFDGEIVVVIRATPESKELAAENTRLKVQVQEQEERIAEWRLRDNMVWNCLEEFREGGEDRYVDVLPRVVARLKAAQENYQKKSEELGDKNVEAARLRRALEQIVTITEKDALPYGGMTCRTIAVEALSPPVRR